MSDALGGYRALVNPIVPPGRQIVNSRDYSITFHDRYDLATYVFWANVNPRLRAITYAMWTEWRAIRATTEAQP
jgi:hypothetical protein